MANDDALQQLMGLAEGQGRVWTRRQAVACGLSKGQVDNLLRCGLWQIMHRGTFTWAGAPPTALQFAYAAVACAGGGAVASHRSAARAYGLVLIDDPPEGRLVDDVTAPGLHRARRRWLVVHRGALPRTEIILSKGLSHTGLGRTLYDLAGSLTTPAAVCAWESALRMPLIAVDELDAVCAGGPSVVQRVRALVEPRSQSPLETLIRLPLRDAGIELVAQHPVYDHDGSLVAILDLGDPIAKVAVEADGAAPHARPEPLYRDRVRQNVLERLGWRLARFTWYDARQRPHYVVGTVQALLRGAGRRVA